jgi:hypothetical protein
MCRILTLAKLAGGGQSGKFILLKLRFAIGKVARISWSDVVQATSFAPISRAQRIQNAKGSLRMNELFG